MCLFLFICHLGIHFWTAQGMRMFHYNMTRMNLKLLWIVSCVPAPQRSILLYLLRPIMLLEACFQLVPTIPWMTKRFHLQIARILTWMQNILVKYMLRKSQLDHQIFFYVSLIFHSLILIYSGFPFTLYQGFHPQNLFFTPRNWKWCQCIHIFRFWIKSLVSLNHAGCL